MGILDWIFGKPKALIVAQHPIRDEPPPPMIECPPGRYPQEAVGESRYLAAFEALYGRRHADGVDIETTAVLVREPGNPHDTNAVRVEIQHHTVGYLPRDAAARIAPQLDARYARRALCSARVRGGWDDGDDEGHFGVYLGIPKRGPLALG